MSYQVIARKWRPQTFADVVGQQHVTSTLANAIQSSRVAHAYIFSGARGVGKTTTARILAKALNCVQGPAAEPCNECDSCREIGLGNSLDVIEIDAASNRGIDQIRELREMVRYAPAGGRYKVVILDEAHMLTSEASNALLKTLEEPPDKVVFVMATTEPENLADTIRSRSQHFHFRALSFAEIVAALEEICVKENLTAQPGALGVMARAAEGSLRDALSLLEQARAYCGTTITDGQVRELLGVVPEEILDELFGAIEARSAERVLTLVHRLLAEGQNLQHFCREAIGYFRNLLVARVCGSDSDLIAAPADRRPHLKQAAELFSEEDLTRFFQILLHTDEDIRRKPDARLHLEMGLLRMVNAARLAPLEEILGDLGSGGKTVEGTHASSTPARASSFASSSAKSPSLATSIGPSAPAITPSTIPTMVSSGVAGSVAMNAAVADQPTPKVTTSLRVEAAPNPPNAKWTNGRATPSTQHSPAAMSQPNASTGQSFATAQAATAVAPAPILTAPIPLESRTSAPSAKLSPARAESESMPAVVATPSQAGAIAASEVDPQLAGAGLDAQQVESIKEAILAQEKFLGELIEHAVRWEMSGGEVRLIFPMESRALAEMLQARDPMERLRTIVSRVLGNAVRVCVKLENMIVTGSAGQNLAGNHELRAKFEKDPIVRAMLERFGGQISDVKRRSEV